MTTTALARLLLQARAFKVRGSQAHHPVWRRRCASNAIPMLTIAMELSGPAPRPSRLFDGLIQRTVPVLIWLPLSPSQCSQSVQLRRPGVRCACVKRVLRLLESLGVWSCLVCNVWPAPLSATPLEPSRMTSGLRSVRKPRLCRLASRPFAPRSRSPSTRPRAPFWPSAAIPRATIRQWFPKCGGCHVRC
jgi:hypothetical protein